MKRIIQIIIFILVILLGILIYFFTGLEQALLNLLLLNVIIYLIRTILIRASNALVKNRVFKYSFSITMNIVWISFLFSLLFLISPTFTIAIISFLIVAISLTFRDIINNVASGFLIISGQIFDPGDLIEINGVQGMVLDITLNYTKIKEFDGVLNYLPNVNIYTSSVTKFTHRKPKKIFLEELNSIEEKKEKAKQYGKLVKKLIENNEKITSYVKNVEFLGSFNPSELDSFLSEVFDKYEEILGLRPTYNVNNTIADRCSVSLRINSTNPQLVLKYTDAFTRDVLFKLHHKEIFLGWEEYLREKTKNREV